MCSGDGDAGHLEERPIPLEKRATISQLMLPVPKRAIEIRAQ